MDRLPIELKILVCSQLCGHCTDPTCSYQTWSLSELQENLNTLSSLSKTCKLLRNIAQPILHHYFPFRRGHTIAQLYLFIRTLTTRPDLASDVRILSLEVANNANKKALRKSHLVYNNLDYERVVQAAARFSLQPPTADEWTPSSPPLSVRDLRAFEFLAPLAVHLCKNAQAIEVYHSEAQPAELLASSVPT